MRLHDRLLVLRKLYCSIVTLEIFAFDISKICGMNEQKVGLLEIVLFLRKLAHVLFMISEVS